MLIPDPTTATKEKGEKLVVIPFFGGQKYHTIRKYLIFKQEKKKNRGLFTKNSSTFYPKDGH
jgi:hypothetical protein